MEEADDILAPAEHGSAALEDSSGGPGRSRLQWVGGILGFMIAATVVGGLFFRVPYVALVPGSARDTESLLQVEGIESFPSDGELLFTTVRVKQRPNFWEYLWLKTDGDVDIVPEELILGDRTPEENRQFNLELMNDSKSIAIAVALEELGYDAVSSDGVLIIEVVPGGAAEGVLTPGDTVVAIDDEPVNHTGDLVSLLADAEPGDTIVLTVEPLPGSVLADGDQASHADPSDGDDSKGDDSKGGDSDGDDSSDDSNGDDSDGDDSDGAAREVSVVLGAKEDDPSAAFLGVGPVDRVDTRNDFDFNVDIDSGVVGGPSAGLAFTLAVLDQLTDGELTGGSIVAVTGTIDASGRVGVVGGVVQKTAAVRDLGADLFIVPAGLPAEELEKIRERAGDDLQIVPVFTLDEALDALAGLGGEVGAVEEFAASNLS